MLDWDDLRVFLAVHRKRSHAGAARALRVASTTIGRRVSSLERATGARLFTRTPDGLAPTAAALQLLARAERVEAECKTWGLAREGLRQGQQVSMVAAEH